MGWAFIKPVCIIAQEIAGVTCVDDLICIDDLSRTYEARRLYEDAISFVLSEAGQFQSIPHAVFCSCKECWRSFGLYRGSYGYAGAYNVGKYGLIISHIGWHAHYTYGLNLYLTFRLKD